jgi:hypothetical protein
MKNLCLLAASAMKTPAFVYHCAASPLPALSSGLEI